MWFDYVDPEVAPNTPIIERPDCADHALARLHRSRNGSNMPVRDTGESI
jgi:hypothetical protein